jgi:hypothetical protein
MFDFNLWVGALAAWLLTPYRPRNAQIGLIAMEITRSLAIHCSHGELGGRAAKI